MRVGRIRIFRPKIRRKEDFERGEYRFSRKSDMFTILSELAQRVQQVEVNRAYKRKALKVYLVDLGKLDGDKPSGISDWVAKLKEKDIQS